MAQANASTKQFAVITGASSGIGLELAKVFAKNDFDLLIAAENDEINHVHNQIDAIGANIQAVQVDLAKPDGVEKLYNAIKATGRPIDAICINAGVGLGQAFHNEKLEDVLNMIDLNVRSTTELAHRVLPDMVARNSGRIMFTASVVSTMPSPFQAVYAATKAFDLSLAEALRNELKDTNVTVTALMPGATETNFFHRAEIDDTKVGASKKDDPAKVAQQGFDALMKNDDKVVAGSIKNKVMTAMTNVMGSPALAEQNRKMNEPGSGKKDKKAS